MGFFKKSRSSRFAFNRNNHNNNHNRGTTVQEQHAELLTGNKCINNKERKMYINKGYDDEMEICCFKQCKMKFSITCIFTILTGGLLRLIFHWIPHWYIYATCKPAKIQEAQKILIIENFKGNHKIYHVKPMKILTSETVTQLMNDVNSLNSNEIRNNTSKLSVHFENGNFQQLDKIYLFNCKKLTYIWNDNKQEFVKLKGLDQNVKCEQFHNNNNNRGLTKNEQFLRRLVYGPNRITIKESSIVTLLFLEILNPFYIFQIGSFILWFLDNYYFYAAAIMAMSVFGIAMSVRQTLVNEKNLKSTVHNSDVCTIVRKAEKLNESGDLCETVETISTELLVPGDVLEIPSHGCIMHCDAVLLTGNCILNESMLTGESVPVTKTALPHLPDLLYDPKEHAKHTLFCGTKVIQTRYFGNEKVLAAVVRTGFSTAKGSLVRSILYPPPVDYRFEKDSYRFVALLAAIACIGFFYTAITKLLRDISVGDLIVEALDLITIVVPPALPAAMTVGRFYAQIRLKKKQIFCISPRTINVSGSIDCVCFDKTGTLTEDGLDLLCVVPVIDSNFLMPIETIENLQYSDLLYGLVCCHSLTIINKQIVGDPLDLKMFESTMWQMEEPDVADNSKFCMIFPTVLKPPPSMAGIHSEIGIIREFPFSSSAQRMGVIMRQLNGQYFEYYCKGSPEMLLNFVNPKSVPQNFHDVLENYTQEGYRVIAIAHKILRLSYAKVQKVTREAIEHDLNLLGLIVLENRLKTDTYPCIKTLNEAEIRVIMVTGDNILTALSVAKDCDIIQAKQSVITVNIDNSHPPNLYYTLTNTKPSKLLAPNTNVQLSNSATSIVSLDTIETNIPSIATSDFGIMRKQQQQQQQQNLQLLLNNYRFAVTGKVWNVIREFYPDLLPRIVTRGNVFARMSPEHKQQLVQELQNLGYCVAMCGDGANDCGALKAAHTGISLSEAESSVASPFTSKNPNITCVLDVIREGRAALVTSFGIFKYMAAYSLCQFVSVIILYGIDSNLTDLEYLYIDLFIISTFAFFFGKNGAYNGKLVKETPLSNLMSFSPILSLFLQLFLVITMQLSALEYLKMQPWYEPFNAATNLTDKDRVGCTENFVIFTVSSFQYIILAIVFSKGKPYRKSIFTNYGFIVSAVIMTSFSMYLALNPSDILRRQFELVLPDNFQFRLNLLLFALLNFCISFIIEHLIIDFVIFKKLRFKLFHNLWKSRRKYLAIEHDLNLDTKWPILTNDFKSAASPIQLPLQCQAEIVIEKERFDKNHVLNKLYENSDFSSPISVQSTHSSTEDTFQSFTSNLDEELPLDLPHSSFECRSTNTSNNNNHIVLEMNHLKN